jgi:hypothetical protein
MKLHALEMEGVEGLGSGGFGAVCGAPRVHSGVEMEAVEKFGAGVELQGSILGVEVISNSVSFSSS